MPAPACRSRSIPASNDERTSRSSRSQKYTRGVARRRPSTFAALGGGGARFVPESLLETMSVSARYTYQASVTVPAIGPTWSSVRDSGTTPSVEISPSLGFRPSTPHAAAGIRMDPPVSVPIVAKAMPVATLTADPPLDPPGERDESWGFLTGPNAESSLVVPYANS